jgi:hypothetical protein
MQCARRHRVARDTGVEEAIEWIADDELREVTRIRFASRKNPRAM